VENELPPIIPEDHARDGAGGEKTEIHPTEPTQRQERNRGAHGLGRSKTTPDNPRIADERDDPDLSPVP